jgi:hypothetical protein
LVPVSYKIIAKFHNEIRDYLKQLYGLPPIIELNNNILEYQKKFDNILYTTNNIHTAGFIAPNGGLKRLKLDFSNFKIKNIYKVLLNLDSDKLTDDYAIEHDAIRYFGFEINDILSAGYMRIGHNKYENQFYIQFDTKFCFPSSKVLCTIENILLEMNTIYIAHGNNDDYAIFSMANGDSIKDIKRYFNQHRC